MLDKNPPIDQVIRCNVIPRFIQFLIAPCGLIDGMNQADVTKPMMAYFAQFF